MVRRSIQSAVDRMSVKLLTLVAVRLEIGLELELTAAHGELLGQIRACEESEDSNTVKFVARLKALSEQIVADDQRTTTTKSTKAAREETRSMDLHGDANGDSRRRGRPKKQGESDAMSVTDRVRQSVTLQEVEAS